MNPIKKPSIYYRPERRTNGHIFTVCFQIDPSATFQAADEKLPLPYSEHQAVFAKKNHAYFLERTYE